MSFFPKMGDLFLWQGKLVEFLWRNGGQETVGFKFVREQDYPKCSHCGGSLPEHNGVEHIASSPLFQKNARPLPQQERKT